MIQAGALAGRGLNATAGGLARLTPLISSIGLSHRAAIKGEQIARAMMSGASDGKVSVHWHQGGQGPALLLLNGFSASGLLWPTGFVRELERSHHVIRMDNRGTGWSRRTGGPFTIAAMADDAWRAIRACGHESAVVAGISMGGAIAQELAIRHPEAVDRLVLMATIPPPPAQVPPKDVTGLLRLTLRPFDGTREHDREYRLKVGRAILAFTSPHFTASPGLVDEIGGQVLRRVTTVKGAVQQSRAIIAWHGPGRLAGIRAQTTVFTGADDPIIAMVNGHRIAELIPGATHVELPRTGHLVPWEADAAVLAALMP